MDGIDIALVKSDGHDSVERGATMFVPYNAGIRTRIEAGLSDAISITQRNQRPGNLAALETEITILHANAVEHFLRANTLDASAVDIVGFHGQTVLHRPDRAMSVQLGNGQQLAETIGIDVIYDMRANDMTHGGQGAPLVPVYHRALAKSIGDASPLQEILPLAFVNIGGISNVTYIGQDDTLIAFDCGPGNALIDQWIKRHTDKNYDDGGRLASQGKVIETIASQYLSHPFFVNSTPKSLDRNDFTALEDDTISLQDGARTLANITARAIMKSVEHFPTPPSCWIICGGGALNKVIVNDLHDLAKPYGADVKLASDLNLDPMTIEAEAFAYLAIRAKLGLELTWPATTGCSQAVSGGVLARC